MSVGACTGCAMVGEAQVGSDLGQAPQLLIREEGAQVGERRDACGNVVLTSGSAKCPGTKLSEME